jgi:glutamate/tyrosine decarboxylase-like PLP-dependent enzyme
VPIDPRAYRDPLHRAAVHAQQWLDSLPDRRVPPAIDADAVRAGLGGPLPDDPTDPGAVVDELAAGAGPGLLGSPTGRFFGWVMGGTLPAALAADWLVTAWDQNSGLRYATPGTVGAEEVAAGWLLDLLGLPATSDVGFTTGATMANFTGLAAGRQHVLDAAGWDVTSRGLAGGPAVRVLAGADRHATLDVALRYLGLGAPTPVAADDQGRLRAEAVRAALADTDAPTIVCLQAGNLHSGAFDPIAEVTADAHEHGAWVHVDGAFGLWAAASPATRHLVLGLDTADSWATDAHKTLNVPYDCGVSIVAHPEPARAAMNIRGDYLVRDTSIPDPLDLVPEMSRRARGVPVWAALRSLGRIGVADLVDRLVAMAQALAAGIGRVDGAEILNDVVFTQVCVSFGSDERTRAVTAALLADGTAWMSGSRWRDRAVLRISVSNWSTDADDVATSVAAVERAVASVPATVGQR